MFSFTFKSTKLSVELLKEHKIMKKVLFTCFLTLLLSSSFLSASDNTFVDEKDGPFNNSLSLSIDLSSEMGEICKDIQLISNLNSAFIFHSETVFAEFPIFSSYMNRAKKLRISEINRICTGFNSTLKV